MTKDHQTEIFFHPGLGKTGTTYLQFKFFPKLRGIYYVPRTRMHKAIRKVKANEYNRYLVSREHDRDFYEVVENFAREFPHAKAIFVLRRHDKWIASQYRRLTKNGRGHMFEEFIDLDNNQGRWNTDILNFHDRILFLEKTFGSKPLVLFHEELKKDPYSFFDKLARFTGSTYRKNKVSLSSKHTAYNDNQLKAVRRFGRKTYFKRDGLTIKEVSSFDRKLRKTICHLILYFYWLFPFQVEKNEPLIDPYSLEKVRERYHNDWEKCLQYAKDNPVDSLIKE